jgi:hypothetical protein
MPYAYSLNANGNISYRGFDSSRPEIFVLAPGEVLFDAIPTDAELLAAFPSYVVPNPAWEAYQAQAQEALTRSDTTMHRIAEGVIAGTTSWTAADVAPWSTYRRALRAIVSATAAGDPTEALPGAPAFPSGT